MDFGPQGTFKALDVAWVSSLKGMLGFREVVGVFLGFCSWGVGICVQDLEFVKEVRQPPMCGQCQSCLYTSSQHQSNWCLKP